MITHTLVNTLVCIDYGIGHQIANPVLKYSECCNKHINPSEANEQSEISQPCTLDPLFHTFVYMVG